MSYGLLNALALALLLTLSHGLLKFVSSKGSGDFFQDIINYWWLIGLSISIYVFIFFYYLFVLGKVNISVLYPVYTGFSIVFVTVMGVLLFGEVIQSKQSWGVVLIVAGVYMVTSVEPSRIG